MSDEPQRDTDTAADGLPEPVDGPQPEGSEGRARIEVEQAPGDDATAADEDAAAADARRDAVLAKHTRSAQEESNWRSRLAATLASAAALALPTLLLTVLRMNEVDVTGRTTPQAALGVTFDFYVIPAFVMFAVAAALGWFGAFRHWLTGALAGVLAAIAGAILGYAVRVLLGGTVALEGQVWAVIAGQIFGLFFPFLALGALLGALVPLVWRSVLRADVLDQAETARRAAAFAPIPADGKVALVRIPGDDMSGEGEPVDAELANEQWETYVATLEEHGWATREVPAAAAMADSAFVADHAVVLGDVAVIARTGASDRRTELPGVRAAIEMEELVTVEIEAPGTLDGGDVLVVEHTIYVGLTARTNAEGVRQLRRIAGELGFRVVAVPVTGALHLTAVASALPDGTVVVWPEAFGDNAPFDRALDVPERLGASTLALDAASVAVSAAAPQTAALIRSLGYAVVELDISEFEKGDNGLTALSARIL